MRLLIGYDGTPGADAALLDLQRAGLPASAECIVLTIADVWLPPSPDSEDDDVTVRGFDPQVQSRILESREAAKAAVAEAGAKSDRAVRAIKSNFPGWMVSGEAFADSPAWGLVKRADEWPAHLIAVGSHSMTVAGRLFVGSVSQRVISHAAGSVRVARSRARKGDAPIRILVGLDGSNDSEAAVREVASRSWPPHTEVRLMTVVDDRMKTAVAARILKLRPWLHAAKDVHDQQWFSRMAENSVDQLRAAGLAATTTLLEGDPKHALLDAAASWQADCVFLGATGLRGLPRLLLGSVSSGVTATAPCTVEVIRAKRS